MTKRNARFWIFHRDGWVKLTVKPGHDLVFGHAERDEEGYHYEWDAYRLTDDGAGVINDWANGGRDCDGRHDRKGSLQCPLSDLAAVPVRMEMPLGDPAMFNGKTICRPDWQLFRPIEIRDSFAELQNY